MKMMCKAFVKRFFGSKYERLLRAFPVCLLVYWGLHISGCQMQIAPFIFYLMINTFTAGIVWEALVSKDNAAAMQNMVMLPFDSRKFTLSYVASLGAYALFTKTALLMAVLAAVKEWSPGEIFTGLLCGVHAVLMAAAVFSLRKHWPAVGIFILSVLGIVLLLGNTSWFAPLTAANMVFSFLLLLHADAYSFYPQKERNIRVRRRYQSGSVGRYLFRYLKCHKNYLLNTAVMWCAAGILPLLFKDIENQFAVLIGFALLSLNTPLGILLSCDPDLEQAVRFLPNQRKAFCVPYCLFIFLCNLTADGIFLGSLQFQKGGVAVWMLAAAVFFALQSAIGSVFLEWFYPIRNWNTESDLWHHPRKYMVPAAMLLLAAAVGAAF